jgi:hypothetical protein
MSPNTFRFGCRPNGEPVRPPENGRTSATGLPFLVTTKTSPLLATSSTNYRPMTVAASISRRLSVTKKAATDSVFTEKEQSSGYTEPLLHGWRLRVEQN